MIDREKRILNLLKKEKELSTSKIAHNISSNQYKTEDTLIELEKQGKIKKLQKKRGVYWSLKLNAIKRKGGKKRCQ